MQSKRYNLILRMVVTVFSAAAISSCIENDVPAPEVLGVFAEFEAEGQTRAAVINEVTRTVSLDLSETVDLKKVKLTKVTLKDPDKATCELEAGSVIDLSSPYKVKIKTVSQYEWTITATQTIIRRFVIENQVGESTFEEHTKSVFAYVPAGTDMTKINVLELKLGPEGQTTYDPELIGEVSFRGEEGVRQVKVTYREVEELWSLYVTETETGLRPVNRSDVWATFVNVSATVLETEGAVVEFGYRKSGGTVWQYVTAVPDATYGYSAKITGLEPATGYEVCLNFNGTITGAPVGFTTEAASQPRNPGFEESGYSEATGNKIGWYFYSDIADKFWDCGNKGAMTIGKSVTTPSTDVRSGATGVSSASLQSQFVGYGVFGKFAAGNMFAGDYAGTNGMNGYINFSRPISSRPSAMTVWYKGNSGIVNHSGGGMPKDEPDKYRIFIALTDWSGEKSVGTAGNPTPPTEGQKQIYTGDIATFIDWYTDPGIIAFGEHVSSEPVTEWTKLTVNLKYRSTERIPTGVVILGTASMYGDYFTGSTDSWLYLDDFEIIYNDNILLQD